MSVSKEALAFGRLVDGAPVVSFGNDDALGLGRLEVHHIARHEQNFGVLLRKDIVCLVPACTVEEEPVYVASVLGAGGQIVSGLALDLKVPAQSVDGEFVLARVVLQRACQEGLREVKAWKPEDLRDSERERERERERESVCERERECVRERERERERER